MSKRKFLATTATATAAVCTWEPVLSFGETGGQAAPKRRHVSLNGPWQVAEAGQTDWIPAAVPGCIHTDLLAAGKIPDPFFRENERGVQWVGERDWVYRRTFEVPAEILEHDRVLLRCDGLDTLAEVKLNGREIGRADNMFRVWEYDVKAQLKTGANTLEILFRSPLPYMKKREAERVLYEWAGSHEPRGRAWVRKEPCNFGWDWGPVLITCGIWRNIGLQAFDRARLQDVLILQDHSVSGKVRLSVEVEAQLVQAQPLEAAVSVAHEGKIAGSRTIDLAQGKGRADFDLNRPNLWWPAGMGAQPLYEVQVELRDARGNPLDRTSRRIGLRTLKVVEPQGRNPLHFEVNGIPFFAKGANWIPADAFATRVTPGVLRRYAADAVAVNMNMLRFWGGGYYEEDALYDACDELGLCVWLDFKFACSSYPAFDDAFMENVRAEARDNLRRLRHHPCIAVWCGNNEISLMTRDHWSSNSMGRADYDKLFKDLLERQVRELAPQANYVSGSPDCGDTHYWQVWHGDKLFDSYRTLAGFMSEFGFQSFPETKTVRSFTTAEDRKSVTSAIMKWHQRSAGRGNERIRDTTRHYFRPPRDFESALWLSQILQGYGIKIGAEYWRQTMPESMGCLFWQYNDCWPAISWSSVDYFGRWKALHYFARRFYAPLLVSATADTRAGTVDVFVTSDRLQPCRGKLTWQATDRDGNELMRGSTTLPVPARHSEKVKTLDLRETVKAHGADKVLTWLKLDVDGQTVSDNLVTFALPKDLKLDEPGLKPSVIRRGESFLVTLTAEKPALWAWLDLENEDARYSDNFIHMKADSRARIVVEPKHRLSETEFTQALRVRSLFDTYLESPAGG